ncbi:uncharacterized protein LOC114928757 [Nylanderia fulva]|uniref:uncharacterized protein LOC114928757 n=1 Tax=Nylanderia fulva TaxID=613905 RepID=UPI0010FB8312|nr:uncharacterized protein LOC114928757 [Nylanderia fulva]
MKYLGLWLDGTWSFGDHFNRLTGKIEGIACCLASVGQTIDYIGCMQIRLAFYPPVWAGEAMATTRIKMCCVEHKRWSPFASSVAIVPWRMQRVRGLVRAQARRQMVEECLGNILPSNSGRRVVGAVRFILEEWVDRPHGRMSFYMTQVFSGHGCFAPRGATTAWRTETRRSTHWSFAQRGQKSAVSLCKKSGTIYRSRQLSARCWKAKRIGMAVVFFCSKVMLQEIAERRERKGEAGKRRRRRLDPEAQEK